MASRRGEYQAVSDLLYDKSTNPQQIGVMELGPKTTQKQKRRQIGRGT